MGDAFDTEYILHEEIGRGGFATVMRGQRRKDSLAVAVKVVDTSNASKVMLTLMLGEIDIMKELDQRNIVKLYSFFERPPKLFITMELMGGGELFDRIAKISEHDENDARTVIRDVLTALAYMHAKGIMHRDMKPENLLLTADYSTVKLADFGFSKHVNGEEKGDICGTPEYVAPEMLMKKPYGVQIDMWSTGVILYILLSGCAPFQELKRSTLFQKIKSGEYSFYEKYWRGVSAEAKDLVSALLTLDPLKRLTASQALNHEWMTSSEEKLKSFPVSEDKMKGFRRFNAKRKIMAVARAVIAMNRMKRFAQSFSSSKKDESAEEPSTIAINPLQETLV